MNELCVFSEAQKSLFGEKMLDCWKGEEWEAVLWGAGLVRKA